MQQAYVANLILNMTPDRNLGLILIAKCIK